MNEVSEGIDTERDQEDVAQNEEGGEKQEESDGPFPRDPVGKRAAPRENDQRPNVVKEKDGERKQYGGIGAERVRKVESEQREDEDNAFSGCFIVGTDVANGYVS